MNKKLFSAFFFLTSFLGVITGMARDISGTVTVSGVGTNLGGTVYLNLVNPSGVVVSSTTAAANGAYTLTGLPNAAGYKLVITNSPTNPSGNRLGDRYAVLVDVVGTNGAAQTGDAALAGVIALPTGIGNVTGQSFQLGQQTAFDCANGVAYQITQDSGSPTSTLYTYNIATGERTLPRVTNYLLNSMMYSSVDNMVWTTVNGTNHIARVGAGGGVIEYAVPNLPVFDSYNIGAELPNGYMFITQSSLNKYYVVDVDPTRATYLELVDPTAGYVLDTAPYGTTYSGAATSINCSDVAFNTSTGAIVGVTNAAGEAVSLNPATGIISILGPVTGLPAGGAYGSTFADATGKLYLFDNGTGNFYQVNLATREATFLVGSTISGGNDGSSCPTAVMCDISINTHPLSDTVCLDPSGANASTFTVTATGTGLSYQWQRSVDGGTTWTNLAADFNNANGSISGVLTSTITVAPKVASWNGYLYRVKVSSGLCAPTSNPATQTININNTAPLLKASSDAPICPATTYNLTNLPIAGNGPAGSTIVFYTSATPSPATLVSDPAAAPAPGTYYAFYKSGECLSPASQQINIGACREPFSCTDGVAYQIAAAGTDPSILYSYNVNSGVRTPIDTLSAVYNSLAYNSADNTMWATQNGTNSIARINADGTTDAFAIANLPSTTFNIGFEIPSGYMVFTSSGINTYYVVDINPARATYLELVDPLNTFARDVAPYGTSMLNGAVLGTADQVFVPSRNFSYGLLTGTNELIRFNPRTGGVANLGAIAGLPASGGYGAAFTDANGDLFAFNNDTGRFYYIDIDAKTANALSTSAPSGSNDGASCPTAVMCDITVTQQPLSDSTCIGSPVTFTTAAASTGTVNYQWQRSVDGGTTWANLAADFSNANGSISGVLTPSITVTPLVAAWNGHMYRVMLSTLGACQPVTTIATLTVFANPPAPTLKTLSDAPVCPATTYNLTNLPFAGTTPAGATLVFYTSATPSAGTLVSDPTAAPAPGTYYAFYQAGNCFGPASQPINIGGCVPPFTCTDGVAYQVAASTGGTSSLYTYDVQTGARALVAATPYSLNALIYGSVDNTLWSVKNDGAGNLVRIDGNGATTQHTVANLPAANYNIGAELPNSYMLITSSGINTYYVIDVNPARSTYLELVDPTNGYAPDTSPFGTTITGAANVGTADLAFNSADNLLYGIRNGSNSLQSINPATGAVADLGAVANLPGSASDAYGAVFGDPTGNLYVFNNDSGSFYQVNIAGQSAALLSGSIPSGNNDGASCPTAVLPVTLASFSVAKEGAVAQLRWTTTEEVNVDRFEIQRSADAKTWKVVGEKAAAGESEVLVSYDFTDHAPLSAANYYRLKMIDNDGTFAFSSIQSVDFPALDALTVYPSPATDRLKIKNFAHVKHVTLHSIDGRKVLEIRTVTSDGLDVSKLIPGIYTVSLTRDDGSKNVQKILIVE